MINKKIVLPILFLSVAIVVASLFWRSELKEAMAKLEELIDENFTTSCG